MGMGNEIARVEGRCKVDVCIRYSTIYFFNRVRFVFVPFYIVVFFVPPAALYI